MYVTRPLSLLRRSPELLTLPPQEGPNSGYLVLFDEECETTTCFGLCKDTAIRGLPFPQNKDLTIHDTSGTGEDSTTSTDEYDVLFIPVLDQPLSSNLYYVVHRRGKHKGEASASSKEEDMGTGCCCTYIKDVKPRPLDPLDIYQQVEINHKKHWGFTAVSAAQDGIPPLFLRSKHWEVYMRTPRHYQLNEAPGLNSSLRARLPEFNFSPSNYSSSETVVVGKWYCPFVFVKEEYGKLKEQMKTSMFYVVTLEQRWDKIFESENNGEEKVVFVDVEVEREVACVDGKEALCDWGHVENGVIWFRSAKNGEGQGSRLLGLSMLVMERMRWEQERVGFKVDEFERKVKIKRTEEFEGKGGWRKFGCYVLVERFVFRRMDGSALLTHDFKHTSQIKCKWE